MLLNAFDRETMNSVEVKGIVWSARGWLPSCHSPAWGVASGCWHASRGVNNFQHTHSSSLKHFLLTQLYFLHNSSVYKRMKRVVWFFSHRFIGAIKVNTGIHATSNFGRHSTSAGWLIGVLPAEAFKIGHSFEHVCLYLRSNPFEEKRKEALLLWRWSKVPGISQD